MAQVHVVDLNAVEFLEGISDLKDDHQFAAYVAVCLAIYARQGPVANDAEWIRGMCKTRYATTVRKALDQLITLGKLKLTDDGLLTNSRCERALATAHRRMGGLHGRATGEQRESNGRAAGDEPVSAKINGLDPVHRATTTTTTKNHTVTTNITDAPRARNGSAGGHGGGGDSPELERLRGWRVPDDLEARLQKQRPDITTEIMRSRTREWREYAAEHGIPRSFYKSWFGWQLATPKRRRVRSM